MPASLALASLLTVAASQQTAVRNTLSFPAAVHLILDGRHYALPAGGIELRSDGHYYVLPTLTMANCLRSNGAAQAITANALHWNSVRTIYLAPTTQDQSAFTLRFVGGEWTVNLASATGDLACDGEVMPSGVLFYGGFE